MTEYFLFVGFVVSIVMPSLEAMGGLALCSDLFNKLSIKVPLGYSFYFVLGYWLSATRVFSGKRAAAVLVGLIGMAITVVPTIVASVGKGAPVETFFSYFWIGVAATSASIFWLGKELLNQFEPKERVGNAIQVLSSCSLGVYLVHVLVLDFIRTYVFAGLGYNLLLIIPLEVLLTISLSFLISYGMRKMPIIGKYCV